VYAGEFFNKYMHGFSIHINVASGSVVHNVDGLSLIIRASSPNTLFIALDRPFQLTVRYYHGLFMHYFSLFWAPTSSHFYRSRAFKAVHYGRRREAMRLLLPQSKLSII